MAKKQLSPIAQQSQTRAYIAVIFVFLLLWFVFQLNIFLVVVFAIIAYFVTLFGSMALGYRKMKNTILQEYKDEYYSKVKNIFTSKVYIISTLHMKNKQSLWKTYVMLDRERQTMSFPAEMVITRENNKIQVTDINQNMKSIFLTENEHYTPRQLHDLVKRFVAENKSENWADIIDQFRTS